MERWVVYAMLSMLFAGVTATIAKLGLENISSDVGLAIRTCFVTVLVLAFAAYIVKPADFASVSRSNLLWLFASSVTTAASWAFYYKAIKLGEVSTVAVIDKGSFLIAVVAAWLLLGERITPRIAIGSLLVLAGLLVVARK